MTCKNIFDILSKNETNWKQVLTVYFGGAKIMATIYLLSLSVISKDVFCNKTRKLL